MTQDEHISGEHINETDTKFAYILSQLEAITVRFLNIESQLAGIEAKIQHINAYIAKQTTEAQQEEFGDTFYERL